VEEYKIEESEDAHPLLREAFVPNYAP